MWFDVIPEIAKKAGLLLMLQASAALVQTAGAVEADSDDGKVAIETAATDSAAPADGQADQASSGQLTAGNDQSLPGAFPPARPFPQWPGREQFRREIVPPPPPGPYMSSALSDVSVKGPAFSANRKPPVQTQASAPAAGGMQKFSPDRPWPDDLRPTQRWKPENGYHYVAPPVGSVQPTGVYNRGYRPAYRPYPVYRGNRQRPPATYTGPRAMNHPWKPTGAQQGQRKGGVARPAAPARMPTRMHSAQMQSPVYQRPPSVGRRQPPAYAQPAHRKPQHDPRYHPVRPPHAAPARPSRTAVPPEANTGQ
ncbi:MAG TPA: hypothetical protein ENJ11_06695 [Gammaproteobacteria bacterium]|nr:hypothetical protein [Gammaproteobacteria bacterium]